MKTYIHDVDFNQKALSNYSAGRPEQILHLYVLGTVCKYSAHSQSNPGAYQLLHQQIN